MLKRTRMIEHTNLISEEDGYKKFNHFQISDELKDLLYKDYHSYKTAHFTRDTQIEELYNRQFTHKYDPIEHKQIFDLYINNVQFKEKAKFIYSIIDEGKFKEFAQQNPEIDNPNDLIISYSVIDSSGVKVQLYKVTIADIAFLF